MRQKREKQSYFLEIIATFIETPNQHANQQLNQEKRDLEENKTGIGMYMYTLLHCFLNIYICSNSFGDEIMAPYNYGRSICGIHIEIY